LRRRVLLGHARFSEGILLAREVVEVTEAGDFLDIRNAKAEAELQDARNCRSCFPQMPGLCACCGKLQVGEPRHRRALTQAIEASLASNFGLPAMKANPRIKYISTTEIEGRKYARLLTVETILDYRAAHTPRGQAIYLPEGWNGGTPAELSVFVRQLAGLLRDEADSRYRCMADDDSFALAMQIRWLALFGSDGSHADMRRRLAANPHCTLRVSAARQ
jgi:hypothetical protein